MVTSADLVNVMWRGGSSWQSDSYASPLQGTEISGVCMPLKEHLSVEVYFLEVPFPLDFILWY